MIEKIKGLKIKGKCFKDEAKLLFFTKPEERISIVYGKNGSGKSTISEGIKVSADKDYHSELSATFIDENQHEIDLPEIKENVFVFNENYIDRNVKINDDGLGTIILLGGQADIQSKIDECQNEIDIAQNEYEQADKLYQQYSQTDNPLNPQYYWQRMQDTLKKSGGWAEIDSKLKNNRRNSSVTNDIILEICILSFSQTCEELQKEFKEKQTLFNKLDDHSNTYPVEIKQIDIASNWENETCSLLAKKIEQPSLSEREKQIFAIIQSNGQSAIDKARIEFGKDATTFCPYCFQSVDEEYKKSLIESINRVLNKDTDEHIEELSKIIFPLFDEDYSIYDALDSDLVKSIVNQIAVCKNLTKEYSDAIIVKQSKVYTPYIMTANGLLKEISSLNQLLVLLEKKRLDFNSAIKQKRDILTRLIELNKKIAHYDVVQDYKAYMKQKKAYDNACADLEKKQKTLSKKKEELKTLSQRKQDVGLAIGSINNALDYVFFKKGRLSIELRDNKYYLKSNGDNVRPKDVSLGERNIIALCYFFTQIVANQDIEKLYQQEAFVIIDDPISSFDFENKVGIMSFLRYQINRIVKENDNSKVLVLSHDLTTIFDLKKAIDEICKSRKGKASLPKLDYAPLELKDSQVKRFERHRNEYATLLVSVYNYAAQGGSENSVTIGNEMRRILEAFSTFTYRKNIEDVSIDTNVLNVLGNKSHYFENLMYRLILHNESHYEEQVYSMHDAINFYEFIAEDEKQRTAKDVLCFIYLLNEPHLNAYLKDVRGAMDNIKIWSQQIPTNQSFEKVMPIATRNLRTIKLFDLPLSAGLGNSIMESDAPYEPYSTENQSCDFALKVSGNSMEPDIVDGSIVLIKCCETIEDGEIGAFFYNGDVYCKKLIYKDKKAFLVSFNPDYKDIPVLEEDTLYVYGKVISVETTVGEQE